MEFLGIGILLIGVLAVVIFFTRGVFSRDLTQALKRVTQQEQELQDRADTIEQRLAQMERDYQLKLKRADIEAERIIQEAKSQAMNIRTAAIEEAKHRARQLMLEADQGRGQMRTEVTRELNSQVIGRACELVRTSLPPAQLTELHRTLTRDLLEILTRMSPGMAGPQTERVVVVTGQPLDDADAQRLTQWVGAALGTSVPVHVDVDASLVAGCVVHIGPTVVDGSLAGRLGQGVAG